jgi:transposase
LQRLTRARYHLVHDLVREKNRFLSTLFLKFSAFVQQEPIKRTFGTTALAVLTEFATAEEVAAQSLEQLTQLIVDRSRNRYENPQEVAAAVHKAARASYRLPKAMADPVNQVLACQVNVIRAMEQQIRELDVAIERLLSTVPQTLHSVKGLGLVFIAGIIAEIGNIERFPNEAALAKYTGLYWSKYQSGNFQAEDTRMTRKGNTYLRYYLVEAANSLRMHDAEFRRYYTLKKAETKTHAHKRALVLTARKLIRLVDCLLRSNRLYKPPQGRLHTGGR